jgi:hypothetical protein
MRLRYLLAIAGAIPTLVVLLTWLTTIVIARSRRRIKCCPSCSSYRIRPSWPRILDIFLNITSVSAFRCEACLKRFYARTSPSYRIPTFPEGVMGRTERADVT